MARPWERDELGAGRRVDMACLREHRPSMLVPTSQGGAFCLECFVDIITDSSSLVVHKSGALREITQALNDSEFRESLIQKRPKFLSAPLAEAIFFTKDEDLAKEITEVMLTTCRLALEIDDMLLQDAMVHICFHLASSETTPWKQGHLFSLHALGLLLEVHCHYANHVPKAITSQPGCMQNLLIALKRPSDEMGVKIFFVFVKLAALEGGMELLVEFCPSLVYLAIRALGISQSDEVRTNSLDLLIALARDSVFDISLSPTPSQEEPDISDWQEPASNFVSRSFVEHFADAMKPSLLSPDTQVQIRSLELIARVCPTNLDISQELHVLVMEGLTDYIFELLRVSGDLDAVAPVAMQALGTLSLALHTFARHFGLGLEPLLRVLEHSFTSAFGNLQKDTLIIIAAGVADRPAMITTTRAEQLMTLLRRSFQQYVNVAKEHSISEISGFGLSPEGLNATCGALGALLKVPTCSNIPSVCAMLEECVYALTTCNNADPIYATQHGGLRSATQLLQETYLFALCQDPPNDCSKKLAEAVITHLELQLLPLFTKNWHLISEEETVSALFSTIKSLIQVGDAFTTGEFARHLVSRYWISMAFETLSKFRSEILKQDVYGVISTIIDKLTLCGEIVENVTAHLSTDVEGLLLSLEQRSHEDSHLIAAHQAIIAILFTTIEYGDRLVEADQLQGSLEQHLIVNTSSSLLASTPFQTLKQFFLLYLDGQETTNSQGRFRSMKAENIMVDLLQQAYVSGIFDHKLPLHALKWLLRKESLFEMNKKLLLKTFKAGTEDRAILAELIHEDCVTEVLLSLFLEVVERHHENDIRIVATGLTKIIRRKRNCAKKFHGHGIVCTLRRFMLLQGVTGPEPTVTSCLELLFDLLLPTDETMAAMDEGAWVDIASQAEKILLSRLDKGNIIQTSSVPLVNLLALIMHKSMKVPSLVDAAKKIYVSENLRKVFEENIVNASQKGSWLTNLDINSEDGVTLSASLLFHLQWLSVYNETGRRIAVQEGMVDRHENLLTTSEDSTEHTIVSSSKISCQHLCQFLCFSKHPLQTLTSSCLVELLSHVTDSSTIYTCNGKLHENLRGCSETFLRTMILLLQGAALGGDGLLRNNAIYCIVRLLAWPPLSLKQKMATTRSPWYKVVAQEVLVSLAQPHQGTLPIEEDYRYLASMLSAVLLVSPRYSWLRSAFNSQLLTSIIEVTKATQSALVGTIDFFLELLKGGFLDCQQVEIMRNSYQALRRICYRKRSTILRTMEILSSEAECPYSVGSTPEYMDSSTQIMHLALYDIEDHLVRFCEGACTPESNNESLLLKIDEFLQISA